MYKSPTAYSNQARGFTLIELMVVVAIIGILAAIGVPKMNAFLKTAETDEAVQQFGRIASTIEGYQGSRSGVTTAQMETVINTYPNLFKSVGSIGSGNLITKVIPHLVLAADANFYYKISVIENAVTDTLDFCILATEETATNPGQVMWSSSLPDIATDMTWENHVYRAHYVADEALVSGGSCTATGAAQ